MGSNLIMSTLSEGTLSAAERQLNGMGLAGARSASSSQLCEWGEIEDQAPERNALSLPEGSKQGQAELGSQAATGQSEGGSSFGALNRPQGVVPAAPEPASERGGINRPEGVVPSVPDDTSAPSAAHQAHHSEEPVRRIRRDRPVGQQAEYEQSDSQGRWNSAAASEVGRSQQSASEASPDRGQGPKSCAGENPELQGCEACLRKHQQLELARLNDKGLVDVSIGCKKREEELQVWPNVAAYSVPCVVAYVVLWPATAITCSNASVEKESCLNSHLCS